MASMKSSEETRLTGYSWKYLYSKLADDESGNCGVFVLLLIAYLALVALAEKLNMSIWGVLFCGLVLLIIICGLSIAKGSISRNNELRQINNYTETSRKNEWRQINNYIETMNGLSLEGKINYLRNNPTASPNAQSRLRELETELYIRDSAKNAAVATMQSESRRQRQPLRREVKNSVWNRDGGRCVECGSKEHLEFDHIIPHSKGGSDTERNLQLLCMNCNRAKHAKI